MQEAFKWKQAEQGTLQHTLQITILPVSKKGSFEGKEEAERATVSMGISIFGED